MQTTKDIISFLGSAEMAQALGCSESAIKITVTRQQFPASWYPVVKSLMAERDRDVPEALFNWKSRDAPTPEQGKAA